MRLFFPCFFFLPTITMEGIKEGRTVHAAASGGSSSAAARCAAAPPAEARTRSSIGACAGRCSPGRLAGAQRSRLGARSRRWAAARGS